MFYNESILKTKGEFIMKYEVVQLEEMIVVGKSIVTTNANNQASEDIG